jgi:hypothetical protein
MAQFKTGNSPFHLGGNQQAYNLGCQLLDLQNRLLVKRKNKHVRVALQLDMPSQRTELYWLGFALRDVVNNKLTQRQQEKVLSRVARKNMQLAALTTALGL